MIEVRYAPVLFDLAAPDSIQRGSPFPAYIFVSVYDPDGLDDVSAVYFEVTKPDSTAGENAVALRDDGQYGDSISGDGRYSVGILSSTDNQQGTYIFKFTAEDSQGDVSNHPEANVTLF